MTTYIVLAVLLTVLALVAISVLWDWRRSGRAFCSPIPRPYRSRDSQEAVWRDRYGERLGDADAVMMMLCDAFSFNPDDRYKFSPDDRYADICRACYPWWKVADCMETERFLMQLEERFGIDVSAEEFPEITLGEIVGLGAPKQNG